MRNKCGLFRGESYGVLRMNEKTWPLRLEQVPNVQKVLRWLYLSLTVAVLVPEGSVREAPLYLIAVPVFTLAAIAALLVRPADRHHWLYRTALAITATVAVWALLQAVSFQGNPLANPVWQAASEALGPLPGSISIVPADTRAAIIPVLLPLAMFSTGILLFSCDGSATTLLRFLAVSGGMVALYGIVQFQLFPDYLLFHKKEHYLQDLTAVLVNRNSIATYLGAVLLLNAGFLYDSLLPVAPRNGWAGKVFYARQHLRITGHSVLHGTIVVITIIALLLTRSRAGTAATFVALSGLACFFVFDAFARIRLRTRRLQELPGRAARLSLGLAAAAGVLLIFAIFGGRVLLRADLQGADDGRFCAYQSMIELLKDNWILGTGLGSFREAYPRYQDPTCGGPNALWDRAHSFYLEGWIDLGVVFIPILLAALIGLTLAFLTGLRKRKALRWVSATGWAILVLFILHSIVDFSIQIPGVAVSFAAIMAGVCAISLNRNASATSSSRRS